MVSALTRSRSLLHRARGSATVTASTSRVAPGGMDRLKDNDASGGDGGRGSAGAGGATAVPGGVTGADGAGIGGREGGGAGGAGGFEVVDPASGKRWYVEPLDTLTPLQARMMATQPDMIVQFAEYLGAEARKNGIAQPKVYVSSAVAFNGRSRRALFAKDDDLLSEGH